MDLEVDSACEHHVRLVEWEVRLSSRSIPTASESEVMLHIFLHLLIFIVYWLKQLIMLTDHQLKFGIDVKVLILKLQIIFKFGIKQVSFCLIGGFQTDYHFLIESEVVLDYFFDALDSVT